ncbi:MAG: chorismate synthase [Dysgonamonadaceae bacterium]|jgi:chorismate synthase|nr:chorismate synthase [Dysgonamonadaceae bacterium]
MNSFGTIFRLTSFGESHGPTIGGVIDGCPPGIEIDFDFVQCELDRRKPGQSAITTSRKEDDKVEFLSGIYEGKTTGTPIGFIIRNNNPHSDDYDNLKDVFRPSHADYTYTMKYDRRDHRGGGRTSARETIARVVGGSIAKLALKSLNIEITAYTSQAGTIKLETTYNKLNLSRKNIESTPIRCPDTEIAEKMIDLIEEVKSQGDTIGGVISCICKGVPVGLGEPVFGKLHAALGNAMLSINSVKGFEFGMGFDGVQHRGSEVNDVFYIKEDGKIGTKTNYSGGIQGGISNGEDIYFRVAFKPIATLLKEQHTVDAHGNEILITAHGRHDPCVLPRAVPIVEAMAAMTLLDYYLLNLTHKK